MNRSPALYNSETDEFEPLPYKWEICWSCRGHGTTSAHLGSFSQEQLNEDPDFAEDYFAGRYDRTCECCDGEGKVKAADEARMTPRQRAEWRAELRADAEYAAEVAHERRQLGGY